MRDRLIWFSLAMTAAVVTGLIVVVTVAAGGSGGGASETGLIVSVDDGRLTEAQRRRATELRDETRRTLRTLPDEASLLAAGYRSIIGPGITAVPGQVEHYFHAEYLADGRELDAGRIESVLTEGQPDGSKRVVAGMYILEPDATMADAPDIAGELTPWHDHQNLCWDESGTQYEGFLLDGKCVPGGTLKIMPPMMHVWVNSTPCGPFAGLEGHGGVCPKGHGSVEHE